MNLLLKKLDRFILWKFFSTFLFAIMILAVIACVVDYSQKVDDFVKNKAPWSSIFFYFLNFIPSIVAMLFPLFVFISTIFFTSKMAYRSEVIAILAGGVSFTRFLRPFVIGSVILGLVSWLGNNYVVPLANQNINHFKSLYYWSHDHRTNANLHLRLSPHFYIYFQDFDYTTNQGNFFTAETIDGTLLKEKVMARTAEFDTLTQSWKLHGVVVRENDGLRESLKQYTDLTKEYKFKPSDLSVDENSKEAMTTPVLSQFIQTQLERGNDQVIFFLLEKYKRSSQPMAAVILCIIGVCIASRRVRGGSGLHLALGIVLSSVYILMLQFVNVFSTNIGLNPLIAVWIPNFVFGVLAFILLRKRVQ